MASSRADEFGSRKARWEEELRVYGKKTAITQSMVDKLGRLIDKVLTAEAELRAIEEEVDEYLDS